MVVEKKLASEGQTRTGIGRKAFEDKVWEWQREYGGNILTQLKRLGASCDWSRERFTLEPNLSSMVLHRYPVFRQNPSNLGCCTPLQSPGKLLQTQLLPGSQNAAHLKIGNEMQAKTSGLESHLSRLGSNQRPHD